MKLHTILALAVALLAAAASYSQIQLGRLAQKEQTEREAAKHQLRQVLEHDPNSKEALFQLARLMVEEGDFASAEALFQKYLVISPSEPAGWAYLVRCAVAKVIRKRQPRRSARSNCWRRQTWLCTHRLRAGWLVLEFPK